MSKVGVLSAVVVISSFILPLSGADGFYWEETRYVVPDGVLFSEVHSTDDGLVFLWQDAPPDNTTETFFISLATSVDGENWIYNRQFLGPYYREEQEIPYFAASVSNDGDIFVAVSEEDYSIHIYRSLDFGLEFEKLSTTSTLTLRGKPRLFHTSAGGLLLFVNSEQKVGVSESSGISYSFSTDGLEWSQFRRLNLPEELGASFLPVHLSHQGEDFVFYQGYAEANSTSFQIFMKRSGDGGRTWGVRQLLTDFIDPDDVGGDFSDYNNQRPSIVSLGSDIAIAWERRRDGQNSQIFYGTVSPQGRFTTPAVRVSNGNFVCNAPRVTSQDGEGYITWFDNSRGNNSVSFAWHNGLAWERVRLSTALPSNSQFPQFAHYRNSFFVVWENEVDARTQIVMVPPDSTVVAPVLRASNFVPGRANSQAQYTVRWDSPYDSSGIAGYSHILSRSPSMVPPRRVTILDDRRVVTAEVAEDGVWYLNVAATDYAGNWSEVSSVQIVRDTTPPNMVSISPLEVDENGRLPSNTGIIGWIPPKNETSLSGYSWRYQRLGDEGFDGDIEEINALAPAGEVLGLETTTNFYNLDNGLWSFSVSAIDVAGNVGEPTRVVFRLNKYRPVTYITRIAVESDILGRYSYSITGRGFSVGGRVESIVFDSDRAEPYDLLISGDNATYEVETDRFINGSLPEALPSAEYWIGVVHPTRGIHFSPSPIALASIGTVKLGDFYARPGGGISVFGARRFTLSPGLLFLVVSVLLLGVLVVMTTGRLAVIVTQGRELRREALELIESTEVPKSVRMKRIESMKRKELALGVRFKFALLVTILMLLIVVMVSLPLAYVTNRNQQEILINGLLQRTEVLLESLVSGTRTYLPTQNFLELGGLPSQMSAMGEDARFVTITGAPVAIEYGEGYDYIWATNDSELLKDGRLDPGVVAMSDDISTELGALAERLNEEAAARVDEVAEEIRLINEKVDPLVAEFIRTSDPEIEEAINVMQEQLRLLNATLNERLQEIGNVVLSYPTYDAMVMDRSNFYYVFYKPVLYRSASDSTYYRGTVRLGVSTARIASEIEERQRQLLVLISLIAVAAIVLGIGGSLILASIIIRPINILVKGVETIRDAGDVVKELNDHIIITKTKDELSMLAGVINQMTENLVEAARANEMLLVGKDVQKQFIPLDVLSGSTKMTTGGAENDGVKIFGYYEGAKGVSGDTFDFIDLDGRHHAFIKCDVAGKGVPASLIMIQVSTVFSNFFREWKQRRQMVVARGRSLELPDLSLLAYRINDTINSVGVAGRFAALITGIIDTRTGKCVLCHAGDSLVHIYDHQAAKVVTRKLAPIPAAGSVSSDLIRDTTGYKKEVHTLTAGDALILYTDGLEESQRKYRNDLFEVIKLMSSDAVAGSDGVDNEDFGNDRIHEIVTTYYSGGIYLLEKHANPIKGEKLEFDFSNAEGTIEGAVLATVSVEKIFRIYPDPSAVVGDVVQVDRKINDFLKKHFRQYDNYFYNPIEPRGVSEEDASIYAHFSHLREDEQYDDLTVLGILKK